jgi:hypothetical protein
MIRAQAVGLRKKMSSAQFQNFAQSFLNSSQIYSEKFSQSFTAILGNEAVKVKANFDSLVGQLIKKSLIHKSEIVPKFTLEIWQSRDQIQLPDLSWAKDYLGSDRLLPYEITKPYKVAFDRSQGILYFYNPISKHASVWIDNDSEISPASFITPFRVIFSWMAESFEGEIIHASAISRDKKGLIINGPSGSGKSTLALLCAQSGYNMLADDVVLFSDGQISAIYNYAKIDPRTSPLDVSGIETFQVEDSSTAKKIFHLNHFNENFYNPVVASAIIFPIFAHMNHFERISSRIALKILAPNCLRELMGGSSVNFKQLSQLVQSIPSYRVAVSTNNEKNLDSINQILSELS